MLRILITLIFVVLLIAYFYNSTENTEQAVKNGSQSLTSSPVPEKTIKLTFEGRSYLLLFEQINGKEILLIPNFTQKRSASAIAQENVCKSASSGGFYTKDNKPLGLFKTDSQTLSKQVTDSTLLTGFFYVDSEGKPYIDSQIPVDAPIILQSGPLFENGKRFPTKTDEYTRRNLVIEDVQGNEYIATLISAENTFDGPKLSDVPPILFSISSPFRVQRALNLDGGNASFFQSSNDFSVSELVAVGSVICIKLPS